MNRRLAGRWWSPSFIADRAPVLLLAAVLIGVTGPGAAASRGSVRAQTTPGQPDAIAALASQLQYDPQQIFRYVADHIAYQPYAGILRGALGTLQARAGNSVDKSLLLAALLSDSQVSYRFARGSLDEATTARIVDSLATDAAAARQLAQDPLTRGMDELASDGASGSPPPTGPLAALYVQQARSIGADATRRLALARTRLDATTALLSNALQGAGIQLPAGSVSLPQAEVDDHTWVQLASGPKWVDLDPTLSSDQAGSVLAPAVETLTQLPDELRYGVEFDVLVERLRGGQLVTDTALKYAGFADQLAGVPVNFGHVTPSGMKTLGIAISSFLGDGWLDYRPTLSVGDQSLVADQSVGFPTGGGTDLFGDEPSPGASVAPVEGEATAEWLQVQVTPPGGQPTVARRTLFDRLPAERRALGELAPEAIQPIELVDLRGTGVDDYPPMLGVRTFAVTTGPTSVAPVVANSTDALGMVALAYHGLRDAMDAQIALDAGARTYVDGPNIASVTVDVGGTAQARTTRIGLDILLRNHGVLPLTGSPISAAESEIVSGVTDQLAERFAIEGLAGIPDAPSRSVGVGEVFEAAATDGIPIRVLRGTVADSLPYGAEADALIQAALASGDVVVVPAQPVMLGDSARIGWWSIDPETGATTDAMDDGAGQEVVEEAVLINGERQAYVCYGAMANWASVAIMAAAEMVSTLAESAIFRLFNGGFQGTSCFAL